MCVRCAAYAADSAQGPAGVHAPTSQLVQCGAQEAGRLVGQRTVVSTLGDLGVRLVAHMHFTLQNTGRRMDRQTDRRTDGQTDGQTQMQVEVREPTHSDSLQESP